MIGWLMVLTHMLDRGVLVLTLHGDVTISDRATVSQKLAEAVRSYTPQAVVIELRTPVVSAAALSAVLRAHRLCGQAGVALSAVATVSSARRLLKAGTDGSGLPVFARRQDAIAAAASPSVATPA
ncbi:hypothetical protein [Streptomyces sp. NPDC018833]|uniref:hypothetical protein n=1 Tax=Streptomyces sp. NPDC018833 TaxID=3365053 RepID=UPI0037AE5282